MTNPTPIEKAVKKEIAISSPSWIRRDYVIIAVLITVLSVLSVVQILSLRNIEKTVKNSENTRIQQEYFSNLVTDAALCTLLTSGAVNTGEIAFEPEPIETYYKQCVLDLAGPSPSSTVSGENK